ncbi:RNA polymerase sigma factor [Candidatus Dojkabacteria bacterium]|uniref:RNA polymerase sigma factor n=1 Tax=Candidatus Dojkabacteria bacterium TaxID=2099670 RepID=A0A955RKF1_9BACT|nr:RNA polymerase sigma factor [Candidatus Dojkabacteria bacterium]
MSERKLITAAQNGDTVAMEKLYSATFNSLFKYIRFKVPSAEIAEDIVSEAYTRAFEKINSFKKRSSFKTFVYAIAKNLLIDFYRERKPLPLEEQIVAIADDKSRGLSREQSELLAKSLKEMSALEREIVELRYMYGFSVRETAQAVGKSISNVKVISHRVIKNSRRKLDKYEQ